MDDSVAVLARAQPTIDALAEQLELRDVRPELYLPLARSLAKSARSATRCPIVGVAGAQGTGKSTLTALLRVLLSDGLGLRVVTVSLDDYYLPKAARAALARQVHSLLATRGVPGTHDVEMLREALQRLRAGQPVELLRFSKAHDDRVTETQSCEGPFDVVLFEGWCVGARAQTEDELREPINTLELTEDTDGRFRSYVNSQIAGSYAGLWTELDQLIYLAAPSFESVYALRAEQEAKLREPVATGIMGESALQRFVQHFERVTRQMLRDAPGYADVVVRLDAERRVQAIEVE
jgi:D-glycerate 3-kinase